MWIFRGSKGHSEFMNYIHLCRVVIPSFHMSSKLKIPSSDSACNLAIYRLYSHSARIIVQHIILLRSNDSSDYPCMLEV